MRNTLINPILKATLPWLVLALSLACTLIAWHLLREASNAKASAAFKSDVQQSVAQIERRMAEYVGLLRSAAALVAESHDIARSDWREYVDYLKIDKNYAGIQAIGYAPMIAPTEVASLVTRIRAEGFPGYVIRPPGVREQYAPIIYVEPFQGANLRAFGYDMLSENVRREAMLRARDSGETALTGKVTLIQEIDQAKSQAGALIYVPVYYKHMLQSNAAQKLQALRGYVYGAFRMIDLITHIVNQSAEDIDIEIFDGKSAKPESMLYDADDKIHSFVTDPPSGLFATQRIVVAGRPWTVNFFAKPQYSRSLYGLTPPVTLLGGGVISLLLFGLVRAQANTRVRAEALASDMTSAFEESQARLDGIIRGATEAIITTDEKQTIVMFNPAAERLLGCSAEQAIGSLLDRFIPERFRGTHGPHVERFAKTGASTRAMGADLDLFALRSDGSEFPIDASISKVELDGKKFLTVLLRDITRRKQAEQSIREVHQFNEEVMASVNEGVIVYDRDLRARVWNPFMETLTGLKREHVLGKHIYEIFPALRDSPVHDTLQRALAGEATAPSAPIGSYRGSAMFWPAVSREALRDDPCIAWTVAAWAPHRNQHGQIVGVIATVTDITQLKQSQDMVQQSNEKLRQLSSHLESVREAERTRIAREIHDELAGTLTGIKMDLSAASDMAKDIPALQQKMSKSTQLIDNAVQATRRIINDLRPSILDNLGVWAAIEWVAQDLAKRANLRCEVTSDNGVAEIELNPAKNTALFRIVQESLSNVWRHAEATRVKVHSCLEAQHVLVEIADDGKGMVEADLIKTGHWGVMGMHERAMVHGGQVSLVSAIGRGTTVRVQMPLDD